MTTGDRPELIGVFPDRAQAESAGDQELAPELSGSVSQP